MQGTENAAGTLGSAIPRGQGTSRRVESQNGDIRVTDGTHRAKVIDVWIYNVGADGKYTREDTGEKKARLCFELHDQQVDGKPVVLDKRMRAYLGEKAMFAKTIGSLTGLVPGSDEMRAYKYAELVGAECLVSTQFDQAKGYTNVTAILPPLAGAPKSAEPAKAPATEPKSSAGAFRKGEPLSPGQAEGIRLLALKLTDSPGGWSDAKMRGAIRKITGGRTNDRDAMDEQEAADLIRALNNLLRDQIADEVPF